jgi:hypothetical protein
MKKKIFIGLIIAIVAAAGTGYYMWNKPKRTAADEKPFAITTADELMNEFSSDETKAWEKYKGDKIIQVKGKIGDIAQDSLTTILLETQDIMGVINCTLIKDQNFSGKIGDSIEIKGICAGYNMDVQLTQCALVQ